MDSLTQIALGSAVAALTAPSRHRRAALIAGGVLGTLPDLDVIPLTLFGADAVCLLTWHRGPSHSLLVLTMLGWLLWLVLCRWWAPAKEAPARWLWAIELALLTHPLLDAFTVYGTQLFWPLPSSPVMGVSIFITFSAMPKRRAGRLARDRRPTTRLALEGSLPPGWNLAANLEGAGSATNLISKPRFRDPSQRANGSMTMTRRGCAPRRKLLLPSYAA